MSHFSTIQTEITNKGYLLEALRQMGYEPEENTMIRGYRGQETAVAVAARAKQGYDIGFTARQGGGYDIVADWFGVQGISEQDFATRLRQQYAVATVTDQVSRQGFQVVEQRDADGKIRIVARRWV